jgi:hypothetical protein
MIDLTAETLISLHTAAALLPAGRRGRAVHLSCLLRWILHGAKGPDGGRVRLEGARIGGRWVTSKEAVQRFAERLTPDLDATPAPPPRTAAKRAKASARASAKLQKLGI